MPTGTRDLRRAQMPAWLKVANADQLGTIAMIVILFDTVFRGISAVQLFGYAQIIGFFYTALKLTSYAAGIAGNIALLIRQPWGAYVGFVAAAIGFWLLAIDAWSLFHIGLGVGLTAPGNLFLI